VRWLFLGLVLAGLLGLGLLIARLMRKGEDRGGWGDGPLTPPPGQGM
jgi:hypothetical protein